MGQLPHHLLSTNPQHNHIIEAHEQREIRTPSEIIEVSMMMYFNKAPEYFFLDLLVLICPGFHIDTHSLKTHAEEGIQQ